MTLQAIELDMSEGFESLSEPEQLFIEAAAEHVRSFLSRNRNVTTLLGSDPQAFCLGLKALRRQGILRGRNFCDWGSGIGVISGLAALNGFDAYGIELEPAFVIEADALCRDFSLPAKFVCGSFVPAGIDESFGVVGTYGATDWRITRGRDVYDVLGRHCSEMDLIYAYPWPREVALYEQLFDLAARSGAILWLYRQGEGPRLLVKM